MLKSLIKLLMITGPDTKKERENQPLPNESLTPGNFPITNYSKFKQVPYVVPLPNEQLMGTVSFGTLEYFYAIGEAWAHLVSRFLPPQPIVLDLGCGCGKLARFLYLNPNLHYIGIDIFLPSIKWCRVAFASVSDRFSFEHFDGYSTVWNPGGKIAARDYEFPICSGGVNFVVAGSLFTHLLEAECMHYLDEVSRVLTVDGLALISIHDEPKEGKLFSGDHSRIDISCDYFVKLAHDRLLLLQTDIGNFWGQRTLLFKKTDSNI